MRLRSTLPCIAIFLGISNAIPTTPSLAKHDSNIDPKALQETIQTDLLPLGPRSLSPRDLSTPTKILSNTLKLLYHNFTIAVPSTTTISQLTTFYTEISSTILKNVASAPKHHFTFTFGAYRLAISCASEALPWQLLSDIVNNLRQWMRDKWAPVAVSFELLGVNPYFVAAPAVIVVSVGVLVPFVTDLLGVGGGG